MCASLEDKRALEIMEGTLMVDGNFQVALPWGHDPPFSGADPGIFDWGVQTLDQKGLFFVANYFSPTPPTANRGSTF